MKQRCPAEITDVNKIINWYVYESFEEIFVFLRTKYKHNIYLFIDDVKQTIDECETPAALSDKVDQISHDMGMLDKTVCLQSLKDEFFLFRIFNISKISELEEIVYPYWAKRTILEYIAEYKYGFDTVASESIYRNNDNQINTTQIQVDALAKGSSEYIESFYVSFVDNASEYIENITSAEDVIKGFQLYFLEKEVLEHSYFSSVSFSEEYISCICREICKTTSYEKIIYFKESILELQKEASLNLSDESILKMEIAKKLNIHINEKNTRLLYDSIFLMKKRILNHLDTVSFL